ncbi:MAG TPA: DUF1294 domain-containing protein [Verrucomicrobiae bacterium]|nr:DUF1294 domain-containing protein [Verrucomicrobiae bacterium]
MIHSYIFLSCLTLAVYGADKLAAVRGARRVPELFLHLLGVAGGWPGGLLAQRLFRHKTRKPRFQGVFWICAALNCLCALLLR